MSQIEVRPLVGIPGLHALELCFFSWFERISCSLDFWFLGLCARMLSVVMWAPTELCSSLFVSILYLRATYKGMDKVAMGSRLNRLDRN